ncbi:MAG: hypothetical protein AAGA85_16965 [Bacteroidota bacterium]
MHRQRLLWYVILASWILQGCTETEAPNPDLSGSAYYPLETGNYWIYQVEEVEILPLGNDTSRYQLREVISDSIVSSLGEVTYLLNRESRADDSSPWRQDSLWTVRKNGQFAVVTQNSVPLIKLVFPVEAGKTWDGHALNNLGTVNYRFDPVDLTDVESSVDLSNASLIKTVISELESDIVGTDMRSEIYANGIGLVQRDELILVVCTSSNCQVLGEVVGGRFLSQVLLEYGAL